MQNPGEQVKNKIGLYIQLNNEQAILLWSSCTNTVLVVVAVML